MKWLKHNLRLALRDLWKDRWYIPAGAVGMWLLWKAAQLLGERFGGG